MAVAAQAFAVVKKDDKAIWNALDRATGRPLDGECGRRDHATLKELVDRLASWNVTFSCTDHRKTYAAVVPAGQLRMRNARAAGMERNHCRQRHWFGRCKRHSIVVSRSRAMVRSTMALFARFRVNGAVSEIFTWGMIT